MIRKLAFALALLNIGFSGLAHALGLGEANVTSSLNQPLRAEIELVSTKGLQDTEILPGLATREEFLKAGVDRVYFLSDLRFKVERNAQGNMVVILTTNKPVREPFLNFLVEVIWPSGRLLREYALLIDPPLFAEEPVAPVAAPVIQPREQEAAGDRVSLPAPVATTSTRSAVAPGTYGATNSKDTLWDIATKARPDRSVSHQQVMLAIQDLNPNAFIGNNINRLKAGQVLRLPTLDQIKKRSQASAIEQVIAQNQAMKPKKSKTLVSAAKNVPSANKSAATASGNELKLVVADSAGSASSTANSGGEAVDGAGAGVDGKLAVTLEKLDKSTLENKELSGRVEDLEEQLATLQRLLTLKNDQLSGLQAQARAAEAASLEAEKVETLSAEVSGGSEAALDDESVALAENMGIDGVAEDAQVQDEVVDEESVESAESVSAKELALAEGAAEEAIPSESEMVQPKADDAPVSEAITMASIVEQLKNNPLYQAIAGLGLLVLLIILWLVSKKNAKAEEKAQELGSSSALAEDEMPVFEEESFEESPSDEDSEDLISEAGLDEDSDNEVAESESESESEPADEDVIAEADVYIAYGRLDQAVNVLEQGISSDPVRSDYRLKLLSVYAELGDAEAFDRQLNELEAIQDPDAIDRALEIKAGMAGTVESEDAFESGGASFEPEQVDEPEMAVPEAEEVDNNFDFDAVSLDDEDDDEDLGIDLSSEDLDLDLDIELDGDELELPEEDAASDLIEYEAASDVPSDVETNVANDSEDVVDAPVELGEVDASTLALEPDETELAADEDDAEDIALDLELGDIELSDELEQESEIELPEDLSLPDELLGLDEDVSEEGATEEEGEPESEAAATADGEESVSDSAVVSDDILDEAVEALGDADDFDADLGDDEDFDFLNGTDEASTKLDLARAYIDMGDVDGARDILLEVEKEGSAEQQADAKTLLGSLD